MLLSAPAGPSSPIALGASGDRRGRRSRRSQVNRPSPQCSAYAAGHICSLPRRASAHRGQRPGRRLWSGRRRGSASSRRSRHLLHRQACEWTSGGTPAPGGLSTSSARGSADDAVPPDRARSEGATVISCPTHGVVSAVAGARRRCDGRHVSVGLAVSDRTRWRSGVPGGVCPGSGVPGAGLEPARPFGQRLLRPPRLPFRHPGPVGGALARRLPGDHLRPRGVGAARERAQ